MTGIYSWNVTLRESVGAFQDLLLLLILRRGMHQLLFAAGFWKLNVDGGFFADNFQMGVGMIVRDDERGFVVCRSLLVDGLFDVDEGEAMALYEALLWLLNLGLDNVIVQVDSKTVVNAFNNPSLNISSFGDYISRSKLLLMFKPNIYVHFVRRNANVLAHRLARASQSFPSPNTWIEPPSFVDDLLQVAYSC
ncbi:hypothetical protein ACS0TY_005005 [Phlomoides rotata]